MPTPDARTERREHWPLDAEVIFLNHGSFGSCPEPVLQVQADLRRRLEHQPVHFMVRELEDRLDAARAALAAFLGADPEDVAFLRNATSGVNAVVRSLPFEPGDQLLTTNHAYNACRNALAYAADRHGAEIAVADIPFPIESPDQAVEAVLAGVTPRTKLALLDHITSQTGLVLPMARLCDELSARGVETLVDGAHAPGMIDLDVPAVGATYYTGNCHKWICAPKGAAFLWVRRDRQQDIRPVNISHGANATRRDRSRFLMEFDWVGTDDPTPFLCVPDALRFVGSLVEGGWEEVRRRNHELVLTGRDMLCEALDVPAPAPDGMLGSLAAVPITDGSGAPPKSALYTDPLQDALIERHRIEVPVIPWPAPPKRVLRISAQLYNHVDEYAALVEALPPLLSAEEAARS